MNSSNLVYVSKLDAAKRELEHAIKLFFNYADFVIIHLTSSAALDVLRGLGKEAGIVSFRDELMQRIKKDKQKVVMDKLNEAYNFFKHASKDPNKIIKFNPEASTFVMWESISLYHKLSGELTGLMFAFNGWFVLRHKGFFINEEMKKTMAQFEDINIEDRNLFLTAAHEIDSRISN